MKINGFFILSYVFFISIGFCQTGDCPKMLPECKEIGFIHTTDNLFECKIEPSNIESVDSYSSNVYIWDTLTTKYKSKAIKIDKLEQKPWGALAHNAYYRFIIRPILWNETKQKDQIIGAEIAKVGAICLYGRITCSNSVYNVEDVDGNSLNSYSWDRNYGYLYLSEGLNGKAMVGSLEVLKNMVRTENDLTDLIDELHLQEKEMRVAPGTSTSFGMFMHVLDEYNKRKLEEQE